MDYSKAALSKMLSEEALVEAIAECSVVEFGHCLQKSEITSVLEALSRYCAQKGAKAKPEIYDAILLRMVQYEKDEVGHRFETWAL